MSDDNKPVPQAGQERPTSTTEEVLRLLHEQRSAANDDALDNRELEQLFGSLSKGLEEGIPDSALGIQSASAITLEELAAGSVQPLALGEIPIVQPSGGVICEKCGFTNAELTRFCGMCGHEHPSAGKVSRDEGEHTNALPTSRKVAAGNGEASRANSGNGWKMACLGVLCMMLGFLAVYQQQWWRLPRWRNKTSSPLKAPAASVPLAVQPTAPNTAGGATPSAVQGTQSVGQPSSSARPPKAAPPTTIKLALAGPTPQDSPAAPQEIELPATAKVPEAGSPPASIQAEPEPKPAQGDALPAPPASVKVSQGVVQGALIYKVRPEYPAAARNARVQGSVVMNAIIGSDGTIQQLQLIKGNPLLVNAAMEAVKKWRYRPYLLDGKPVEIETTITINFKGE